MRPALDDVFTRAKNGLFLTCFSSASHRVQQIIDLSVEHGRKVALIGRSLVTATELRLALEGQPWWWTAGLILGIVIGVMQTMTSIQEQTLTFAPRILAVAVVMIVTMPWALRTTSLFTLRMMAHLTEAGR